MRLTNNIRYVLIASIATLFACKKVVTLNLSTAPTTIVIEGNVTNQSGPYFVSITNTVGFYASNTFPPISGAVVKITDSTTGFIDSLTELYAGSGIYTTSKLVGTIGHTYLLDVIAGGKEYKASSTMPKEITFDSLSFITNNGFGKPLTNPVANFQDPAGINNYYNFVETIKGKPSKQIFTFSDRLSDGRYVTKQLFNDSTYIQHGDTVEVEMQCIDKYVYNYLEQLSGQDDTNGQPTSPADPTSNLTYGALGYFSAHTSQKKKAVYQ